MMTDDEIIAVVQAHKEGKVIQFRMLNGSDKAWSLARWPVWAFNEQEEVKPETVGQFTGLHDKHTFEIYEGDILSPEIFLRTGYYKFPVIFRDGRFMLSGKLSGFDTLHKSLLHSKKAKNEYVVIGNIYANPNLLSDKR